MTVPAFVIEELARLSITLSDEQLAQLATYLNHLLTTNKTMNLTAIRELDAAWRRLIIDSLTVLPMLDDVLEGAKLIDVGSGGGLPGVPVAIARPDVYVTLLETTGKKARFLETCVTVVGLTNVSVVQARAETAGQESAHRQKYDAAISRAIGPMRELLEYCLPLVKLGGVVLAMKGPKAEEELDEAGDAIMTLGGGEIQVMEAYPESFDIGTVVIRITKEHATPQEFPRAPGMPRLQPL
ncbi:MAG: 16S rRNA (guanine(527)-N(7))-methyltransferase RsmG [Phycisphaeraceae bacterium]